MRHPLLALLIVAGLLGPGCAAKTDCIKLKKEMDRCGQQVWQALEPYAGNSTIFRNTKNQQHFRYCKKVKGRYKQSATINKCLGIKDCKKFARCFCKAVKKKGCGAVK